EVATDTGPGARRLEQHADSEVEIVRADDPVALREALEDRVRRRRTGGEACSRRAAFQVGKAALESLAVRVLISPVEIAGDEPALVVALERRRQVDRRDDGAGRGIDLPAGVHDTGPEPQVIFQGPPPRCRPS